MNKRIPLLITCLILCSTLLFSTSITFTFANSQITGSSPKYFEFDVMVHADESGTAYNLGMAYINYNTDAFGPSVKTNGKIIVTRGSYWNPFPFTVVNDNQPSMVAITLDFMYSDVLINTLPTSPVVYCHVKLEILDASENSNIHFQQSLMVGQQFKADHTQYSPVIANDTEDVPLPVNMTSYYIEQTDNYLIVNWEVESELALLGYYILRSETDDGNFERINHEIIQCMNNSSCQNNYHYNDYNVVTNRIYFYKIEVISETGEVEKQTNPFRGILSIQGPGNYRIYQNYPNPFNASTQFKYDLPFSGNVQLSVYDTKGVLMSLLLNEFQNAGTHTLTWSSNELSSGIYFYKLQFGEFSSIKKMYHSEIVNIIILK
ncbi:T9SS type A sorting domain-containing protein [bacterium]